MKMKKRYFCFTLFLLICLSIPLMATAQTVNIPDANLRAAVEKALGKTAGDTITANDMATLTSLEARKSKIRNLTGLETAINLTDLRLGSNRIQNISPLKGLTNLTDLRLGSNRIKNIASLVKNTGLGNGDMVNLSKNPLSAESISTDIPTLQGRGVQVRFDAPKTVTIPDANLRSIIERALGKTAGATITPAEMATLTSLEARRSNISDLTGLETAINLTTLTLRSNDISDISAVAGLTKLTELHVALNGRNGVSDISAVKGLTNLTTLGLDYNQIVDISPLKGLTNLTWLRIASNSLTDILPLKGLTNLTLLDLGGNLGGPYISNISPLSKLTNLTELYLSSNRITDISAVSKLTNLKKLSLSYNYNITNISPVSKLTQLTYLNLAENRITNISAVKGLTNLTELYLSSNNITDISAVKGLTNLTDLYLHSNSITDISAVKGLTNLTDLQLNSNSITDISPLVANTGLGDWDLVYLSGNPLSTESIDTHIPALKSRGVTVSFRAAAAPAMAQVEGASVVVLSGLIVDQTARKNQYTFRVTVKNLSNGKAATGITIDGEGVGYQLEVEAGQVGDILEISTQSPDPSIAVQPIRYTVTAEDVKRGWIQLEALVAYEIPAATELLPNYPNPFNPETWIPYRLAEDAFVTLTIYDGKGQVVRTFDVGHRMAAVYENRSQAVYWDGRNAFGEPVSSGVYFYHLSAGDYSATRRMLILK